VEKKLYKLDNEEGTEDLDNTLCAYLSKDMDIERTIEKLHEILKTACNKSFRTQRAVKKATVNKSVPWWTEELTIMRKRTNALRQRYQRMGNNEQLRELCKTQYLEGKAKYAATIKNEKTRSWKEYCNMTSSAKPWNGVYKIAVGKRSNNTQITTLRKPDGSLTAEIKRNYKDYAGVFHPGR
jgi:hypothetical protein